MKVIVTGHSYLLDNVDGSQPQKLNFIQKAYNGSSFATVNDGTTNEEVISVLIDRVSYLNGVLPCEENKEAVLHLESALHALNSRTRRRVDAGVEGTHVNH